MGAISQQFPIELNSSWRLQMKQAKWAVAVMLVVFSGFAVGQRLGSSTIVAEVPFQFVAANRVVPAGECKVQAQTMDGRTLIIRNVEAKKSLFATISEAESKQAAANYTLVFARYGDQYFLTGIKLAGSNIEYRLPESRLQHELRAQNVTSTQETVLAGLE
jgi:hypothetical protein